MKWHEISGGFQHDRAYDNAILGGSPNANMQNGMPLTQAHDNGVGFGMGAEGDVTNMTLSLNLTGWATNDAGQYLLNRSYVHDGTPYNWALTIQGRKNGGAWTIIDNLGIIWKHDTTGDWDLSYKGTWLRTAQNSQWSKGGYNFSNYDQIGVSIAGDNATQVKPAIFNVSDLIEDYKPMAIRKNGKWETINRPSGFIKIRQGGAWVDKSKETYPEGQVNKGHNRIRQSGTWKQQGVRPK